MIINDLFNNKKTVVAEGPTDGREDNFTIDDIKRLETIRDLETLKAQAKELIKGKPARRMKPEKISWFYNHIDTLKNPLAVIKMMYDLMLAGEGNKVIGSRNSMASNSYRSRFGEQGMAEGKKPNSYHIVNKDGKPATLASYADRASAEKDRDAKHPGAEVRQLGPRGKVKNVSEVSLGDYRKKAALDKAVAQTDRFFGRDDPAKVASADQTIAKRERGLARADARIKPYTPPQHDAEKYQRDLTAKYPNIDELVAQAEKNRDPYYDRAEGTAYYRGRDAEHNYQRLKQIQRVIQGLNESRNQTQP